jgi:RHS repeat-associated protein
LSDALGSQAFVIDYQTGEVVERPSYLVYGAPDTDYRTERWQYYREDVRLGGHWDHAEVGLVHMGARYYAPQLGRFISPDPLVVHGAGISNPYEYAYGAPTHFADPSGLIPESDGYDQMTAEELAAAQIANEDWSPDPPGTVAENASDVTGGSRRTSIREES